MSGYRLSPAAQADLSDIWDHTARHWDSDQAERYVYAIRERIEGLASGRIPGRSAEDLREGYFKCAAGSHMIYFRHATGGTIDVVRILHQSMDAETHLN